MAPAPILSHQLWDIATNPVTTPLEGRQYRQEKFLQQLLCHGNIAPSVNISVIFDTPTPFYGVN